jgi:serine/threonine protein kinase
MPCEPTSVITTLELEMNIRRKRWVEDENGNRKRGKEGYAPIDYDKCVHDIWSRDEPPKPVDMKAGSIYDYYDIYEELGRGAFGVVHRGVEKKTGKTYAVKFVKTPSLAEKTMVKKECDLMNHLIHPRLLNFHDLFDNENGGYEMAIVMEFMSGGELFEKISQSNYKMTEYEAKRYIRQLCEGLKHMHENSIVHLNIKPENIMFETKAVPSTSSNLKLVDFSLAAKLDPEEVVKVTLADIEFASPEIIDNEAVGFSTDMWSIGVLTYVLLSGLHPFAGLDQNEISENIKRCEYQFQPHLFSQISENGKNFIRKLLLKNRSERMNVFEALEHPWLNLTTNDNDFTLTSNLYDNIRKKIKDNYATWPEPNPAIGRLANYSSLKKLRPKEYNIYSSYFDRRDAAPRFVIRPRNQHLTEGQNAQFICFIVAASPPVVSWFHGTNELKQSTKHMKKYDRTCYILEIKRCTLKDTGEYIVKAVNSYGERDYNAFLIVDPAPVVKDVESVKHEETVRYRRPAQEMKFNLWQEPDAKATFTFKLRPRLIQNGIGCKLLCCLSGKPTPSVQWFKDGKEIDLGQTHYQIEYTSGVCTLEIGSCCLNDNGVYMCRAENMLGFDETKCNVTVEECKYIKPKALIQELEHSTTTTTTSYQQSSRTKRESLDLSKCKLNLILLFYYWTFS